MFSFLFPNTSIPKADFDDIRYAIQHPKKVFLINTLPSLEQDTLIKNTIHSNDEEQLINDILNNTLLNVSEITIIVYGKNTNDATIEKKYYQLKKLGFQQVFVYYGGMFEWALLSELYGSDEFPTTLKIRDILKFKSAQSSGIQKYKMIQY